MRKIMVTKALAAVGVVLLVGMNPARGQGQSQGSGSELQIPPAGVIANSRPVQPPSPATVTPPAAPTQTIVLPPAKPSLPDPVPMIQQTGFVQNGPELTGEVNGPLAIEKTAPASFLLNKPATYVIVVRNVSTSELRNVHVEEELPAGVQFLKAEPTAEQSQGRLLWNIDRIERGAERRFNIEVQPTEKGGLHSKATASCAATSTLQTRVFAQEVSLNIKGPQLLQQGESADYEVQVVNTGDVPITRLLVRDELPEGLVHIHGATIEAPLGTLNPGDQRILPLQVRATSKGVQRNRLLVLAEGKIISEHIQEIPVKAPTGLKLEIGTKTEPMELDSETVYTVHLINQGETEMHNVQVRAIVPEGLAFVAAESPTGFHEKNREVLFDMEPQMRGKAEITYRVRVHAQKAGEWPFRVQLNSEQGDKSIVKEEIAQVKVGGVKK